MTFPLTSPKPCAAHARHAPAPAYTELHHVVPQAWQQIWVPEGAKLTAEPLSHADQDSWPEGLAEEVRENEEAMMRAWGARGEDRPLWDPRTVPLCPTGHRNVHFWLVRVMRQMKADGAILMLRGEDRADQLAVLQRAATQVGKTARREHRTVNRSEFAIAGQAVTRWIDARGRVADLIEANQYGAA